MSKVFAEQVRDKDFLDVNKVAGVSRFKVGSLDSLGFSKKKIEVIKGILRKDKGIFLITGPVKGGKSTVLKSIVKTLLKDKKFVILASSDFYAFNGNTLLFTPDNVSKVLKSSYDIVVIDEIIEQEHIKHLAELAKNSLVITTYQGLGSILALSNLAAALAYQQKKDVSIVGVLYVELVNTLCPHCKEKVKNTNKITKNTVFKSLADSYGKGLNSVYNFYEAVGCEECNDGYKGRTVISELLADEKILADFLTKGVSYSVFTRYFRDSGLGAKEFDIFKKLVNGIIDINEAEKVILGYLR